MCNVSSTKFVCNVSSTAKMRDLFVHEHWEALVHGVVKGSFHSAHHSNKGVSTAGIALSILEEQNVTTHAKSNNFDALAHAVRLRSVRPAPSNFCVPAQALR